MTDLFDVLSADHADVKQILIQLESGPSQAEGATKAELDVRAKVAEQLIIESYKHEAVEEQDFWPTVRDRVAIGDELADHAIGQEDEAKQVLARLDKVEPGDPEFDDLLTKFVPAAREHMTYEETQVWPALRQVLSDAEAEYLGAVLTDAKKTAPTRPHQSTPENVPQTSRPGCGLNQMRQGNVAAR